MITIAVFIIVAVGLSIYDIVSLRRKKLKKDIIFYISFMAIAMIFGVIYFSNDYQVSFSDYVLNLIGGSK